MTGTRSGARKYSAARASDVERRATVESAHDPIPAAPGGVSVKVTVTVHPERQDIEIDLTDNIDCQPCGLHLSEATARTAAMVGVFNSLHMDVPSSAGSFRALDIKLRENCVVGIPRQTAGALLIFDEVISGFRLAPGGAQEVTGITPDLAVIAKAMGNGFPISAFGGRADIMEIVSAGRAFHAGTYSGGGVPVAAALATVSRLACEPAIYTRMRDLGTTLMKELAARAANYGHEVRVNGAGPVFFLWFSSDEVLSFEDHLKADWARYRRFSELMLLNGVRLIPTAGRWYLNAAHSDGDIDATIEAADRAFAKLGV